MSIQEGSLDPLAWREYARKDWTRIFVHLEKEDFEASAFFLQQSLEKYLKGYLLQRGWKLKKIHPLHPLLKEASQSNPDLASYLPLCERVSGYYIIERYPPLTSLDLTRGDLQRDLELARGLILTLFPDEDLKC